MPRELSTGLVIAGAYANKLRRTLFAQLKDMVKANKEFAREVARASGEINKLLYIILVEKLHADKGDVVRVRVQYDIVDGRIVWNYDTLRLEYFKRVPDEEVAEKVREVIREYLEGIKAEYAEAPSQEEAERILRGEKREFEIGERKEEEEKREEESVEKEEAGEKTIEIMGETQPIRRVVFPAGAEYIGDTFEGYPMFKLVDEGGGNIGVATIEPLGDGYVVDAIVVPGSGEAYRFYGYIEGDPQRYRDEPSLLVEQLRRVRVTRLAPEKAAELIKSKMALIEG